MAITPNYSHAGDANLAKIKLNNSIYYVKDADLRAVVEAFGTATSKNSTNSVTSTGTNLPTESAIYTLVNNQLSPIGKAVNLLSASTTAEVTNPSTGDIVISSTGKEYLYDGSNWREIGDENTYVPKTTTVAGVSLSSNISKSDLQGALDLDALAYKSSASGSLTNYANGISGASYTPSGSVSVSLSQTKTAANLTSANYTPSGTVTVTPSTTTLYKVTSVGTAPSLTESKASFATEGVVATIDTSDSEMLVFSTAGTSQAIYSTNWNAGTTPTLESEPTTVATGISSATFSGSTETNLKITGVSYSKASVSAASFSGSEATIAPTLTTTTKTVTVS